MSPQSDSQNVWFGIAMFLMGLVAGIVLTFASGKFPTTRQAQAPAQPQGQGQQQPPAAPQVSVQDRMIAIAKDIGLDEAKFKDCIASDKFKELIASDESGGVAAGVNGTPGNIVYSLTSKKGFLVSGAQPFENFQTVIDAVMKNPKYAGSQSAPAAKNVPAIDFEKDHIRGNKDAKIAVIEYSDFECPFCHRVHPTYKQIMDKYGDNVMWVYRHFPLSFHQDAEPLAIGSECASELGGSDAFWAFADQIVIAEQ